MKEPCRLDLVWDTPSPWGRALLLLARCGLRRGLSRLASFAAEPIVVRVGRTRLSMHLRAAHERHLFLGFDEREVLGILAEALRPGDVAIDVGANVGFHAALMAERVGPRGRVHAFEPDPDLAGRLRWIEARNPHRNLEVHPLAIGRADGASTLYLSESTGLSSLVEAWSPATRRGTVEVPMRSLDSFVAERDLRAIRLIKVDVEGHEADVLEGMHRSLERGIAEHILFEVAPPDHPARDPRLPAALDRLEAFGYRIRGIAAGAFLSRSEFESDPSRIAPGFNLLATRRDDS